MTTDEVYQYFGTAYAATKAMGITKQAFSGWIKNGFIPFKRQEKIEALTKGKLIAREEDAKKSNPSTDDNDKSLNYLPNFRYYDKKYGMCKVESIHFRKDKRPKITYIAKGKKSTSFITKNLMQATDLTDSYGRTVFEGDILKLKNGEKIVFEKIEDIDKLEKYVGLFKIIGSVFE